MQSLGTVRPSVKRRRAAFATAGVLWHDSAEIDQEFESFVLFVFFVLFVVKNERRI
jgi:hypothetical protein